MAIWVNESGQPIVDASGAPIDCEDCPCSELDCPVCTATLPAVVTVSGIVVSGVDCPSCETDINDLEFEIPRFGNCNYVEDFPFTDCEGAEFQIRVEFVGGFGSVLLRVLMTHSTEGLMGSWTLVLATGVLAAPNCIGTHTVPWTTGAIRNARCEAVGTTPDSVTVEVLAP